MPEGPEEKMFLSGLFTERGKNNEKQTAKTRNVKNEKERGNRRLSFCQSLADRIVYIYIISIAVLAGL